MGRVWHYGDVQLSQPTLKCASVKLLHFTFFGRLFQILNGSFGSGNDGRRKGGGKDESGSIGSDHIDQSAGPGHITSHDPKGLTEGTGNDINLIKDASIVSERT